MEDILHMQVKPDGAGLKAKDFKLRRIKGPCQHCGRVEDGHWYKPCPAEDCPSHEKGSGKR